MGRMGCGIWGTMGIWVSWHICYSCLETTHKKEPFLPYVAPAVTLCFPRCQRMNSFLQVHLELRLELRDGEHEQAIVKDISMRVVTVTIRVGSSEEKQVSVGKSMIKKWPGWMLKAQKKQKEVWLVMRPSQSDSTIRKAASTIAIPIAVSKS